MRHRVGNCSRTLRRLEARNAELEKCMDQQEKRIEQQAQRIGELERKLA